MSVFIKNTALYTDHYELVMAQGYFLSGRADATACFDYFFRKLPFNGGYVVFAGLHDVLEILEQLTFDSDDLEFLQSQGFNEDFLAFLRKFKFKGSIDAANEGEIVFANEPVLRVRGNILETQIIETLLLNIINFESLVATKASRIKLAAGGRHVIDFGLRRAQGLGGIHASRAAIIGGAESTSNVYAAFKFGLKTMGTMAHSWIQSFENELKAFRVFSKIFPNQCTLLVDTYDTLRSGVPNAITVAHEMEAEGHRLQGVRLDSGDLAYLSKQTRAMLDKEGLSYVKIVASNQLDEHIIKSLLNQGAPLDVFGVGTSLVTGKEDAALDGVYKLSMYDDRPRLKISENLEKILLPGMKKIYRYFNGDNKFYADAVVREVEGEIDRMFHPHQSFKQVELKNFKKELLLTTVMKDGRTVMSKSNPYEIAAYAKERLEQLPDEHKRFENPHVYKVGISKELMNLRDEMIKSRSDLNT